MGFVLNDVLSYKVNKNEPLKKKKQKKQMQLILPWIYKKKNFPHQRISSCCSKDNVTSSY